MKALNLFLILFLVVSISACNDDLGMPMLPDNAPEAPPEAGQVFPQSPAEAEIITRNMQNLLCNSVLHADAGRQDQAYQKLDLAKNDKLVAMLDKGKITQDQYDALDVWLQELIDFLYSDFPDYPLVEQTFPFTCAGMDEQSEAIGEVEELHEVYDVSNANEFVREVCYSLFAAEVQLYPDSATHLVNASLIAGQMVVSGEVTNEHKEQLSYWISDVVEVLLNNPHDYEGLSAVFSCEQYEADYSPLNVAETVEQVVEDIIDDAGGIINDVIDVISGWF